MSFMTYYRTFWVTLASCMGKNCNRSRWRLKRFSYQHFSKYQQKKELHVTKQKDTTIQITGKRSGVYWTKGIRCREVESQRVSINFTGDNVHLAWWANQLFTSFHRCPGTSLAADERGRDQQASIPQKVSQVSLQEWLYISVSQF